MLILTRKAEEAIVIDSVTTIRILSIDGDRVKIGIDAPTSVPILREELLEQVAGQNREQARPNRRVHAAQQAQNPDEDPQGNENPKSQDSEVK